MKGNDTRQELNPYKQRIIVKVITQVLIKDNYIFFYPFFWTKKKWQKWLWKCITGLIRRCNIYDSTKEWEDKTTRSKEITQASNSNLQKEMKSSRNGK